MRKQVWKNFWFHVWSQLSGDLNLGFSDTDVITNSIDAGSVLEAGYNLVGLKPVASIAISLCILPKAAQHGH